MPLRVPRPLGATFVDTELQRPNVTRLSRKAVLREESADNIQDPTTKVVIQCQKIKRPLMLGKNVLTEDSLNNGQVYLDKILKRKGTTDGETEGEDDDETSFSSRADKGTKKARLDTGSSSGSKRSKRSKEDEDFYNNENTVKPENVLRMVDPSLADTPDRSLREDYNEDVYASGDDHSPTM